MRPRLISSRFLLSTALLPLLVGCLAGGSSTPSAVVPESPLARLSTRVDTFLQGAIDRGDVNAAAALVFSAGEQRYFKTFGWRDKEAGEALQRDAIFRLASMTKPIVSVAAMQLYEQGKFKLDDPVSQYLPEFENVMVWQPEGEPRKPSRPVLVVDILSHTSGLSYGFSAPKALQAQHAATGFAGLALLEDVRVRDRLPDLLRIPLAHDPGANWTYGHNTEVLGVLVEVWSGQSLDVYLREHIFTPLGMVDTGFYLKESRLPRLVQVYSRDAETGVLEVSETQAKKWPPGHPGHFDFWEAALHPERGAQVWFAGGGGLLGTTADYARFCQMLLNGGSLNGVKIIGGETLALMLQPHTVGLPRSPQMAEAMAGLEFSLGFAVVVESAQVGSGIPNGSFFWGGAYNTMFWVDPGSGLYVVMMSQIIPNDRNSMRRDMERAVYGPAQ